jgi:uncharacterized protein (DUF58 family)
MKLTSTGRDYLLAVLVAGAVGLLTGEVVFAALGLAATFMCIISLVLLRSRLPASVEIRVEEPKVRLFKREKGTITLRIPGLQSSWARVEVDSVGFDGPMTSSVALKGPEHVSVTFSPRAAGRYARAWAKVSVRDTLGLFSVPRSVALAGVTIDSLPLALMARPNPVYVPPLIVGDSPAGAPGKGQEFYGIEEYTQHSESKDILWKRAARAPDRPLLARVREANSPESVTLEVCSGELTAERRASLVDLECEALGELGRDLLLAGVEVRLTGPDGVTRTADDDDVLAEAIMEVSAAASGIGMERHFEGGPVIALVVGDVEADLLEALPRGPVVYVGGTGPHVIDPNAVDFSGVEPLTGVVTRVLGA